MIVQNIPNVRTNWENDFFDQLCDGGMIQADVIDRKLREIVRGQARNGEGRNEVKVLDTFEMQVLLETGRIPNYWETQKVLLVSLKDARYSCHVLENRVLTTMCIHGGAGNTHQNEIREKLRVEGTRTVQVIGLLGSNNCGPTCLSIAQFVVNAGNLPPLVLGSMNINSLNISPQMMRNSLIIDERARLNRR